MQIILVQIFHQPQQGQATRSIPPLAVDIADQDQSMGIADQDQPVGIADQDQPVRVVDQDQLVGIAGKPP